MKISDACGLLTAALLTACADDVSTPPAVVPASPPIPATLPPTVAIDQFHSVLAAVECAALFQCPAWGPSAGLRAYYADYARCVARPDALSGGVARRHSAALVRAGSIRYDGAAARGCLEALRGASCNAPQPAACARVFAGTVALGGRCARPDDCGPDAYCDTRMATGSGPCRGTCTARIPLGERCFGDGSACSQTGALGAVQCQYDPTLTGSGERYPYRCVDSAGVGVAAEGEVCTDYRNGMRLMRACAEGLDCQARTSSSGSYAVCAPPPAEGEACSRYCRAGAVCEFDGTRFMQRCLAFVVRSREGETCVQGNTGGEVCNVLMGLDCVAGRCRRVGTGAEGSVCFSARFGVTSCEAGLHCSPASQTCQRRKADGSLCRSGDECESRECTTDGMTPARCGLQSACS